MLEIKNFTETTFEFEEVTRLYNLVSHDHVDHPDDMKEGWEIRDKSLIRDRLLLYKNDQMLGYLGYAQGRKENAKNCYFNIFLDPSYNGNGYRQLLYDKMLEEVQIFNCNRLYADVFEHPNYDDYKQVLIHNGFKLGLSIREYSLNLNNVDINAYSALLEKLDSNGIKFYDSKNQMTDFPNHYKKLEALLWTYGQDFPMPEGIAHTRSPFDQYIKYQKLFEEKRYGIQIVAVDGEKYVGATDIYVMPKGDPHKAWTGSLGVLRDYRRRGIAIALKIKAFEKLRQKGIKTVRTDNEKNNPMYKINVALGFTPEPFCYEYQKEI